MQVEDIILQDFHIKNTILSNFELVKCSSFFEKIKIQSKKTVKRLFLKQT